MHVDPEAGPVMHVRADAGRLYCNVQFAALARGDCVAYTWLTPAGTVYHRRRSVKVPPPPWY